MRERLLPISGAALSTVGLVTLIATAAEEPPLPGAALTGLGLGLFASGHAAILFSGIVRPPLRAAVVVTDGALLIGGTSIVLLNVVDFETLGWLWILFEAAVALIVLGHLVVVLGAIGSVLPPALQAPAARRIRLLVVGSVLVAYGPMWWFWGVSPFSFLGAGAILFIMADLFIAAGLVLSGLVMIGLGVFSRDRSRVTGRGGEGSRQ